MNEVTGSLSEEEKIGHMDLLWRVASTWEADFEKPSIDSEGVVLLRDTSRVCAILLSPSEFVGRMKDEYKDVKNRMMDAYEYSPYAASHKILGWEVNPRRTFDDSWNSFTDGCYLAVQAILIPKQP